MPKIKYIGGLGPLDQRLPVSGGVLVVENNHTYEVSDADAGYPPEPRYLEAMAELNDVVNGVPNHEDARRLRAEIARLNPGDGLLAQIDNYQPVAPKKEEGDSK